MIVYRTLVAGYRRLMLVERGAEEAIERWDLAAFVGVVIAVIGAALVATYAVAIPLAVLHHPQDAVWLAAIIAVRETAALAVVLAAAPRYLKASPAELGLRRPRARNVLLGLGLGLVFMETVTRIVVALFPEGAESTFFSALARGAWSAHLAAIIVVGAYSPFVQEVVFRGLLLTGLAQRMPTPAAVVLSAGVFGIVHAQSGPGWVINAFAFGLVAGAFFVRSRSLAGPIATHVTTNTFSVVTFFLYLHRIRF